jgi:hypothetical protein
VARGADSDSVDGHRGASRVADQPRAGHASARCDRTYFLQRVPVAAGVPVAGVGTSRTLLAAVAVERDRIVRGGGGQLQPGREAAAGASDESSPRAPRDQGTFTSAMPALSRSRRV